MEDLQFFKIDKWIGVGNFALWSCTMRDKIIARGLDATLEMTKPKIMMIQTWEAMKRKVCSFIRLNLSGKIQMEVLSYSSSTEIWEYLEKQYLDKSSSNRMLAKARLYACKMKEGEELAAHVRHWTSMSCESVALGDKPMEDEDKAFLLLNSLASSLEHLIQTIMFGRDKLRFDEVHNSLLTEATRKGSIGTKNASFVPALVIEERGRSKKKDSWKGRPKSMNRDVECWKCGQVGHIKKHCWKKDVERSKSQDKGASSSSTHVVEATREDDDFIL